jgi:hypothetical protein
VLSAPRSFTSGKLRGKRATHKDQQISGRGQNVIFSAVCPWHTLRTQLSFSKNERLIVSLMPASTASSIAEQIVEEVARLFPIFLEDPVDREMSKGNAAICVIDSTGRFHGRILGADKAKARWCFGIANRKVIQVWSTGYAMGRFEELVYAGKLDDTQFGINRPDFIGWEGGVPLVLDDGSFMAAAFSGIRGINDVAIIVRAVAAISGVSVKQ